MTPNRPRRLKPDEQIDFLRLARTESIGPVRGSRLLARYGSPAAAIEALPQYFSDADTVPVPPSRAQVSRELAELDRIGGRMIFLGTPDYPPLLAMLHGAPLVLSVLGDLRAAAATCIAIVGARNASAAGSRMAEQLSTAIADAGMSVVSGLARGIDAAAHRGALLVPGGRTIAAIAGGLDRPYPPENIELQASIAEQGGLVIAEAPLGTAPQARHFPRRNRIIAGLSIGIVAIEAARKSGALITIRHGQEAGREIFAVPGSPLDPRCEGSNDLLRQGAHLTERVEDILDNLPPSPDAVGLLRDPLFAYAKREREARQERVDPANAHQNPPPPPVIHAGGPLEARSRLLELLGPSPCSVDDLIRRCQFSASAVMAALLELEVAGRVSLLPGNLAALAPAE